jgi:phenylalanyl-tRNA synthetase beta chain
MNISYNWLRDLTGVTLEPRELAELLTRLGLAVEVVHEASDDFVLEIDLTSNRPDCLSHLGVARDVAAAVNGRVLLPEVQSSSDEGRSESYAAVEIRDADLCPRYAARVVSGVTIKPSPGWLAKRLEAIGQRSINNVADITNYVLHEQGQPLHAFDLAKLAEKRIVVRRAVGGEKLKTLDGTLRELDSEMLVIADAVRPVALAGVMGGEDSEISDSTRDVLIESAYFNPASVRRTSKLLGLHTEASHRFERGVDYEGVLRAQERCIALICELAGGTATVDAIDVYPKRIEPQVVSFRPERVKKLTGLDVAPDESRRILISLGFTEKSAAASTAAMTFVAPTWRVDIEREEDLVEEVARHTGYEKITTELPASNIAGEYQSSERRRRSLRQALVASGFDEAISFSFIDEAHDDRFELLPNFADDAEAAERFITLTNPIIEGITRMRPTLLSGLLDAVRHNLNHGTRDIRLFETGRVFAASADNDKSAGDSVSPALPREKEACALIATGVATEEGRAGGARELDFYDLKGALEATTQAMNLKPLRFEAARMKHLRDGQAARITTSDGQDVGSLGRLDEAVAALYKFRQPVYVAEIDLSALLEMDEMPVLYTPLPRYPSIGRDVSLLVGRRVTLAEMLDCVRDGQVENCRDVRLVDVYEGASLPAGKRSVTLRMEYRSEERTLRDEDVDEMHARLVEALVEKFGAQQR